MEVKINVEGLKMLCQASKRDLLTWLTAQMTEYYGKENVVAPGDYLFCQGNFPVMLCAHVDTVFHEQPSVFSYNEKKNTLSSPQGIGGDDRCGVYSILRILKELEGDKKPFLFFSSDEEVGGASTKKAAKEVKGKIATVNYLIELDRQGEKDSVYYKCGNKKFKTWIDSFGFVEAKGSFTDICTLCKEWDLAGVNFSVGYVGNHHVSEVIHLDHLAATIEKTINVLNATDPDVLFTFCEEDPFAGNYWNKQGDGKKTTFPDSKKTAKNTFISGDVVRAKFDTVGFIYSPHKGKEKEVKSYVAIPEQTKVIVVASSDDEILVKFDDVALNAGGTKELFYASPVDMCFVSHNTIPAICSQK